MIGPLKGNPSWQQRQQTGFAREAFTIDHDRRQVTCPNGKTSGDWLEPPAQAPYLVVKFDRRLCDPCPDRARCTRSREGRTVTFLPRHLHQHLARNPARLQLAARLRHAIRRRGHDQRVRQRPPRPRLPLPWPGKDPRATRTHRHRRERRTAARPPSTGRPLAASHSLPAIPRQPRPTHTPLVAPRRGITDHQDPRRSRPLRSASHRKRVQPPSSAH